MHRELVKFFLIAPYSCCRFTARWLTLNFRSSRGKGIFGISLMFFLCSEPSYTFERTGIYGFAQGEKVLPFFISQLKSKERAPISS